MAYYSDLSAYTYGGDRYFSVPDTVNVGWLSSEHLFKRATPSEELLDRVWSLSKVSVAPAKGRHYCEFCAEPDATIGRGDEHLKLGRAEIRVFSTHGRIYAAPNLLYHYICAHGYLPPVEFVAPLVGGFAPPDREYFEQVNKVDRMWNWTDGQDKSRLIRLTRDGFVCDDEYWGKPQFFRPWEFRKIV